MSTQKIINWENLYKNSETFKNNKPFRFAFVEEVFHRPFYEKLYETFPNPDNSWEQNQFRRVSKMKPLLDGSDELKEELHLSKEWNDFKTYMCSKEFLENFSNFIGIKVAKTLHSAFVVNTKGGFQLPHIDYDGNYPHKIQIMLYFSKNWQKGDPGGTYICKNEDETSIIFEPYNLDNSMVCFEETLGSWHGTRYITKDVTRRALGIALK
ncbi:MAG: 2OG-Fe(II) oxygenase [Nitrosotalea sp.]